MRLHWAGVAMRFVPTWVIYPAGSSHFQLFWRDNRDIFLDAPLAGVPPAVDSSCCASAAGPCRLGHGDQAVARAAHPLVAHPGSGDRCLGMQIMLTSYRPLGRRGFPLLLYPVIGYFTDRPRPAPGIPGLSGLARALRRRAATLPAEPRSSFRHFLRFGEAAPRQAGGLARRHHGAGGGAGGARALRCRHQQRSGRSLLGSHPADLEVVPRFGSRKQGCASTRWCSPATRPASTPCSNRSTRDSQISTSFQVQELGPIPPSQVCQGEAGAGEWVVIVGDRTSCDPGEAGDLG